MNHSEKNTGHKAHIVSVSMGYGHQRAAYALKDCSPQHLPLNANDYEDIPKKDKKIWEGSRTVYEFMSNASRIPIIGGLIFYGLDRITQILSFYPRRNLSESSLSTRYIETLIGRGWGQHLVNKITSVYPPLPLISTFFVPAYMADRAHYAGKIFCVVTDTDLARTWVVSKPEKSKIIYLAPTQEAERRLLSYGVPQERIKLTGFPLPTENIGGEKHEIAKKDIARRLLNIDPKGTYKKLYGSLIESYIGPLPESSGRPLTLMLSLGGAAAQRDMFMAVTNSLFKKIRGGKINIILAIGIKKSVHDYIELGLRIQHLHDLIGENIKIIKASIIWEYFDKFNAALRETDILWTKPSELSFYAGLGIPLLIAPPIGSQEEFNKQWLLRLHAAVEQENPMYTDEWLFDLLDEGVFAEAAMHGFIEIEKNGVQNIKKLLQ